jgi:flavodoxin
MKAMIVLVSYYHSNTRRIAEVFSRVLNAPVKSPRQINPRDLKEYDLVGFGSGIYSEKHHEAVLDFADSLPEMIGKKAFIFSTCGVPEKYIEETRSAAIKFHWTLRDKLQSKGYTLLLMNLFVQA